MSRRNIYYWKCDRPAAFHGTQTRAEPDSQLENQLRDELRRHFATESITLAPGVGQGNHLTWNADIDGIAMFVRVENGPERDGHLAVESQLLDQVREAGVPTPKVLGYDATRRRVDFAWQALERINAPDLNQWFKQGRLAVPGIAFEIGVAVATWQSLTFTGFGTLDETLRGFHARYADYYRIRLDEHLAFLVKRGFLTGPQRDGMVAEINRHQSLLELAPGCFVHKDLALWNILGSETQVAAFIDFDDSVSGDPLDDLSLLGCFHDAAFLNQVLAGYQTVRPLPAEYRRRFWLHLLRNMIVKSVIRVGAGYFDRTDGFFLIGSGTSGADLRRFTEQRLAIALRGLRDDSDLSLL
jgi:fructosamine-3-kinase